MSRSILIDQLSNFTDTVKSGRGVATKNVVLFRVEDLVTSPDFVSLYTKRNYFKISLVAGESDIFYADRSFHIENYALVFTNPFIPYQWDTGDNPQSGYVCAFTEDFLLPFENPAVIPAFTSSSAAVISLNSNEFDQYAGIFLKMIAELQSDYEHRYDYARNLIMLLIHEGQKLQPANGQIPVPGNAASRRIVSLFQELLNRKMPGAALDVTPINRAELSPSALAAQLNIHVNHLNKVIKDVLGYTTSSLIDQRIVAEAKSMLEEPQLQINDIAWSLGFEEPQHFSRFFKRNVRITPSQYRDRANL